MRYSQVQTIPDTGIANIGSIGGDSFVKGDQLGYHTPPRTGVMWIHQLIPEEVVQPLEVTLRCYDNRLMVARAPGRIVTELPVDVIVRGPAGTSFQVLAWEVTSTGADRGAARSVRRAGSDVSAAVPTWAASFDWDPSADAAVATFRDAAAAVVGVASGRFLHTNFSLPDGAASVDLTGADSFLVFRQNG